MLDPVRFFTKLGWRILFSLIWVDFLELSFSNFVQTLALEHGTLKMIYIALFLIIPSSILSNCMKIEGKQSDASNNISHFVNPTFC